MARGSVSPTGTLELPRKAGTPEWLRSVTVSGGVLPCRRQRCAADFLFFAWTTFVVEGCLDGFQLVVLVTLL
jgi:hypothetical protein